MGSPLFKIICLLITACLCQRSSLELTASVFPYRIIDLDQRQIPERVGRETLIHCEAGESHLHLVPKYGEIWDMSDVSVLSLNVENMSSEEIDIHLKLENQGATEWSFSALGRTVLHGGESRSAGVILYREQTPEGVGFGKMIGTPDRSRRHWHFIQPESVRRLSLRIFCKQAVILKLEQLFSEQNIEQHQLNKGPFVDKFGQYRHGAWPSKIEGHDLVASKKENQRFWKGLDAPIETSRYGGLKDGPRFEARGHFYTQRYRDRWWFVDPEGYLFWSYGMNCVGVTWGGQTPVRAEQHVFHELPQRQDASFGQFYEDVEVEDQHHRPRQVPHYRFTESNLYRKHGPNWRDINLENSLHRLQKSGLNTIGAWSDDDIVSKCRFPYTAIIHYNYAFAAGKLPDPFDPKTTRGLRQAIADYPVAFHDDPWCLGVFVNNELHWKNHASELVLSILKYPGESCAKKAFAEFLQSKYSSVQDLNAAWGTELKGWGALGTVSKMAKSDAEALASLFADTFYKMISAELDEAAPERLFLGSRFNAAPNEVIKAMAKYADVISANMYSYRGQVQHYGQTDKPILLSEFHFANAQGNNLGAGLRAAHDTVQQGRLMKAYLSEALDHPQVLGAHWFQRRDQCVSGRYDGENYDIGFLDIVDQVKPDLIHASRSFAKAMSRAIR
jgi:hypothetical protein